MLGRLDQLKFVDWKSKRKKVHRNDLKLFGQSP